MSKSTMRNLIISLITFILVGGAVAMAFLNVLSSSQKLEQQIIAVASQNQQETSLLRLQKIAQKSETEREELESYFLFRESDSISFMSEIESLAPAFDLEIKQPDLSNVTQDGKAWIQADYSIIGDRADIKKFIQTVENIPYVSRLTSVNMSGGRNKKWQADIIIQVQLLNYDQ